MSERTRTRRGPQSPLTTAQKRALSMLANRLWEENESLRDREWSGEVTKSQQAREWRKRVLMENFGIESLTEATDSQYLEIRGSILDAAGLSAEALADFLKSMKAKGRGEEDDTPENRGKLVWNIEHELAQHEGVTTGYALKIARDQTRTPGLTRLENLTARQLKNLLITVKNRLGRKKNEKRKI